MEATQPSIILALWGVRYQVKDVQRSIRFYTQIPGFNLDHQHFPAFGQVSMSWCDGGYKEGIADWVKIELGWTLKVVQPPWAQLYTTYARVGTTVDWDTIRPGGFHVLPGSG